MDLKDKIVGLAMACLIALIGWQLHQTWSLKEEVLKSGLITEKEFLKIVNPKKMTGPNR